MDGAEPWLLFGSLLLQSAFLLPFVKIEFCDGRSGLHVPYRQNGKTVDWNRKTANVSPKQ
jgi:hypothetical protein